MYEESVGGPWVPGAIVVVVVGTGPGVAVVVVVGDEGEAVVVELSGAFVVGASVVVFCAIAELSKRTTTTTAKETNRVMLLSDDWGPREA